MKGILLAGGNGHRLWPNTVSLSKHLFPIYDKPMIYYSFSTLLLAGVTEIAVIVTPRYRNLYQTLLGSGTKFGIKIYYCDQQQPTGIPDALKIVPDSFKNDSVILVLGDNLLYGSGLGSILKNTYSNSGALIFGHEVSNPQDYGVLVLNSNGVVIDIEEKPKVPKSRLAVPGIYYFDKHCFEFVNELSPSKRGETEIVQLLKKYLNSNQLEMQKLPRGYTWLDTGSYDNMLEASEFIRVLQLRHGVKISCPEEIALREGLIDKEMFYEIYQTMPNSDYREYLKQVLENF